MHTPHAAQHRALSCYDILFTIFDQLATPEAAWYDYDALIEGPQSWYSCKPEAERRATLARCARVCRAFFGPAIAVLWKNVDSLSPLVAILGTPIHHDKRPQLSPQSLASLYAKHVRAIHSSRPTDGLPIARDLPLLPNLQHLRWVQYVPGDAGLLQAVSPALRSLHIVFRRSSARKGETHSLSECEAYVRDLLPKVAAKAPLLRYLRISTSVAARGSWLETIGCFTHLESVDMLQRMYVAPDTAPILLPLASLPHLQHLKLCLPTNVPSGLGQKAFPSLKTLTLDTLYAPLSAVSTLLSSISSRNLHTLLIQNCGLANGTINSVHDVCDIIRVQFASTLRKLELSTEKLHLASTSVHPQSLVAYIEPLLDLHDLEDIRIAIPPDVALTPSSGRCLEKLAEAWPNATTLHVHHGTATAFPTIAELVGVSRHCPHLVDLVVPGLNSAPPPVARTHKAGHADALTSPTRSHTMAEWPVVRSLRSFSLSDDGRHSKISDPLQVAEALDSLFPDTEWRCPPRAAERWRETIEEVVRRRVMRMFG